MNILFLVEVGGNAVLVRNSSDIADSDFRAFFHNVSQRTGSLDSSLSIEYGNLQRHNNSAHGRPCKTVYQTDLVALGILVVKVFFSSEELLNIPFTDTNGLLFTAYYQLCGLPAQLGNAAFKGSYARFFGIIVYNGVKRVVGKLQHYRFQTVCFKLLGNKVLLCYMELFLTGIACDLDNIHTVEQRRVNSLSGVRSRYKKHVA